MWLNVSIAKLNATLQLLVIYRLNLEEVGVKLNLKEVGFMVEIG